MYRLGKTLLLVAVGGVLGYLTYYGHSLMPHGLSWRVLVPLFFIVYFVALFVHEMGHFLAFYFQGIPCRGIFVFFLFFIKRKNKWRLEIRWNIVTFFGGVVFPDYEGPIDEQNFNRVRKAFARAIIFGPIASILLAVMAVGTFLAVTAYFPGGMAQILSFYVSAFVMFIAFFIVLLSSFENEAAIGDFPAYRYVRKNDFFAALQLYQSYIYASNPGRYRENTRYLASVLDRGIEDRLENMQYGLFTYEAVHQRLMSHLSGDEETLPQSVERAVKALYTNRVLFRERLEIAKVLSFRIVPVVKALYGESTAIDYYQSLLERFPKRDSVLEYMRKQQAHYLGLEKHGETLLDKEKVRTSMLHPVLKFFEGYYRDDLKFNRSFVHTS